MQKPPGDLPLSRRIYLALRQRIESGEWNFGAVMPTENQLTQDYNVSRGTIRQVLAKLENEGFVRRERGRGTFMMRMEPGKPFPGNNSHTISFIVPYVRDSFVSSILLGIESAARESGFAVVFHHVENDIEKQEQTLRMAVEQGAAGVILYPVNSTVKSRVVDDLVARHYPLVMVDRYVRNLYTDYVMSDNFGGGLLATQHLLCLGHRRIAFLSWVELATTMEHRKAGYQQALFEAGLDPDPELEWEVVGYPEIDQEALETFLSQKECPSAVFAANDQLALAVQRAARNLQVSIPGNLALVGFDNLDISAHLDIPLTTIAQPSYEIGRTAFELVLERIQQAGACPQARILPVRLVVRRSCGAIQPFYKGGGR